MAIILKFVDSIGASPTTRLDLNAGVWSPMIDGSTFEPPELRRAVASTMLADGAQIPAAAYDNREIVLRLLVDTTDADAVATANQALFRELDRPSNFLMFAPNTTAPVFFRTFRSAPRSLDPVTYGGEQYTVVSIPAEPFALGLEETAISTTISQDPANFGMSVDVSGVKGDVETPLVLSSSNTTLQQSVIAMRRHDVTEVPFLLQAESMTPGTDTTFPGSDVAMSGTGNSYARCTFTTSGLMIPRLDSTGHPSVDSVGARGTYRVFGRFRRSSATGTINVQLRAGLSTTIISTTPTLQATSIHYLDLGLVSIPSGTDPVTDGPGGTVLPAKGIVIVLHAERTSGSSNLDIDCLLFVPADDRMAIVQWPLGIAPGGTVVLDGTSDVLYRTLSGSVESRTTGGFFMGGVPLVSPGVTNRVYFLKNVGIAGSSDLTGVAVEATYWPRYLYVRPPTT